MQVAFEDELNQILDYAKSLYDLSSVNFCVAVSGGADSLSLLFLMASWAKKYNKKVFCVTIDHGLRAASFDEALYVGEICKSLNVEHHILKWQHQKIEEAKIERAARSARYELLNAFAIKNNINFILTGHTLNDKLETFKMRNFKGSGAFGLAGISRLRSLSHRVKLLRPLMIFKKDRLKDFLLQGGVTWIEDEMNADEKFLRVKFRKEINEYSDLFFMDEISKIKQYARERIKIEKGVHFFLKNNLKTLFSPLGNAFIDIKELEKCPLLEQQEILARVISSVGGKEYKMNLNFSNISELFRRCTLGRAVINKKQQKLNIFRENRNFFGVSLDKELLWDSRFRLRAGSLRAAVPSADSLGTNDSEAVAPGADVLEPDDSGATVLGMDEGFTVNAIGDLKKFKGGLEGFCGDKQALYGIPCVFKNGELQAVPNLNFYKNKHINIESVFEYKVNLLDVFI